jgi:hypothetical protein
MTVKPLNLTLPTVHLNGTSRQALLDGYTHALAAIQAAQQALQQAAPNGRDYYPQGNHTINRATEEHVDRLRRLESIQRELNALALHVSDSGGSR